MVCISVLVDCHCGYVWVTDRLSVCLSVWRTEWLLQLLLAGWLINWLTDRPSVCLTDGPPDCLHVGLSVWLLLTWLSVSPSDCLYAGLSVCLSVWLTDVIYSITPIEMKLEKVTYPSQKFPLLHNKHTLWWSTSHHSSGTHQMVWAWLYSLMVLLDLLAPSEEHLPP